MKLLNSCLVNMGPAIICPTASGGFVLTPSRISTLAVLTADDKVVAKAPSWFQNAHPSQQKKSLV